MSSVLCEPAVEGMEVSATDACFKDALVAAFDYRGDVTLTLLSGDTVEGYVFSVDHGYVDLYPKTDANKRRIPIEMLSGIVFSGRDTAK